MAKPTNLRFPRSFRALSLLILPLAPAFGDVIGVGTQLGHFGVDTFNPVHDFSPPFQTGPQSRAYQDGSSGATAGLGALGVTGAYVSSDNNQWGNADLKLNTYFADTITIDAPGRAGQAGAFTVSFTFDGSYDANLWWESSVSINCGFGTDPGDGVIPSMQSANNYGVDNAFTYRGDDTYGFGFGYNMFLGQEQTATIAFTFGQPFDFWLRLGARIHVTESEPGNARLAVSLVQWSGISRVTAGGVAVSDFTVGGANSTGWAEPMTHALPRTGAPNIVAVEITAGAITLRAADGTPNAPCVVLSTPFLGEDLAEWPIFLRSRYDTMGQFTTTLPIEPAEPFRFYLVQ